MSIKFVSTTFSRIKIKLKGTSEQLMEHIYVMLDENKKMEQTEGAVVNHQMNRIKNGMNLKYTRPRSN